MLKDRRKYFPDPRYTLADGLVAISDELSINILKEAYGLGIFPWPYEESPILWFSPDPRGIFYFREMHLSQSFKKFVKKCHWQVSWNTSFEQVIEECAKQKRQDQEGTWITESLLEIYKKLHRAGFAHSVEVWEEEKLIGGVYGVFIDGCFSGESMFFHQSQASKVALLALVIELQSIGLEWMDIQMVTPHLASWGGKYISREHFYVELAKAQDRAHSLKALSPRSASFQSVIANGARKNKEDEDSQQNGKGKQ